MQGRPQLRLRMSSRELRGETAVAMAFAAVAIPLALFAPTSGDRSPLVAAFFVALYAVVSRIEFDVGAGYGTPAQVVLVPMLLAVPPGRVPLLVAAGFLLGRLPSYVAGTRDPLSAVAAVANAWHAIGPAVVFILAHITEPRWSDSGILIGALAAQLACDLVATVAREWLRLGEPPKILLRVLGPVYLTDVCLSPIGLAIAFAAVHRPLAAAISLPLGGLLALFARDRRARMEAAVELSHAYRGTALLLGEVVEADDAYTGSHSRDVVDLAIAIELGMGLDEDQRRNLELAALLHDVGKIAISKTIINKPGPLTPAERAVIETHTIEGQKMLENVGGVLSEVGRIVRSCHERYDGRGYPDGLARDAIPVEARIIAGCDALNAMTTNRPYRGALSLSDALGELLVNRGTQFDPTVVDLLLSLHAVPAEAGETMPAETEPYFLSV